MKNSINLQNFKQIWPIAFLILHFYLSIVFSSATMTSYLSSFKQKWGLKSRKWRRPCLQLWASVSQEPVGLWRSVMARSFGFLALSFEPYLLLNPEFPFKKALTSQGAFPSSFSPLAYLEKDVNHWLVFWGTFGAAVAWRTLLVMWPCNDNTIYEALSFKNSSQFVLKTKALLKFCQRNLKIWHNFCDINTLAKSSIVRRWKAKFEWHWKLFPPIRNRD